MEKRIHRIAFLGPAPPFRGGIAKFASSLAGVYADSGNEVCMFNFIHQFPNLIFPGSSQLEEVSPNLPSERVLTPYLPYTWPQSIRRIRRFQPDLLIVSYWMPYMVPAYAWILNKLKKEANSPHIVLLVHNIEFHERWPLATRLTRYLLDQTDQILVLSQKTQQDVAALSTKYENRIKLGFHPIYEDYNSTQVDLPHAAKSRPTVLFFGFIKAYKGLDVLLKAMVRVKKQLPAVRLIIAGDVYGDASVWRDMIRDLNLEDITQADLKYISSSQIQEYFNQSSVCVLPYKTATQSGIIATAYAFNLPVIASDVGGLSEYLIEGKTGLLVPANNEIALAEKIVQYFVEGLEEQMREQVGEFKQRFSWPKLAELILE
jgi:glycosyltransferase involved in cell wall biosynthesis